MVRLMGVNAPPFAAPHEILHGALRGTPWMGYPVMYTTDWVRTWMLWNPWIVAGGPPRPYIPRANATDGIHDTGYVERKPRYITPSMGVIYSPMPCRTGYYPAVYGANLANGVPHEGVLYEVVYPMGPYHTAVQTVVQRRMLQQ